MIIAVIFFKAIGRKNSEKYQIYYDDHSSLSSTTAAKYEFHIYFTRMLQLLRANTIAAAQGFYWIGRKEE